MSAWEARQSKYSVPLVIKAHANGCNKSQHCCVLLANNVASVCMGLNV